MSTPPSNPQRSSSSPRRLALSLAIFVGAIVALLPAPAWAHARLVSSSPADGQVLQKAPREVVLSFSDDVSDLAHIAVASAPDSSMTTGKPSVNGSRVTQVLDEAPSGTYTIDYRVVSRDGHVAIGKVRFHIAPAAVTSATGDMTPVIVNPSADGAGHGTTPGADRAASMEPRPARSGDWRTGAFAAALLIVAVGGGWAAARGRRRAN